jgi:hypothetical protein
VIAIAIDVILILVLIEGVGLVVFNKATGRGVTAKQSLGMLAAGFFLMLAARLALDVGRDASIEAQAPVAACLLAALVAHLADLALRWR